MAAPTVRLHPDPPGSAFIRAIICRAKGQTDPATVALAERECKSTPQLVPFFQAGGFERQAQLLQKGAIAAGAMGTNHGISDLDPYQISGEGFQIMQSASIFGRLSPSCRRVPFRTLSPREYGGGAGSAWRGEGLPRPVMTTTVDQVQTEVFEASTVFVVTREVLRFGQIAEQMLRNIVAAAVSKFIDSQLLDPSVASSSAHPAAITYGASTTTSTGSSAAQITADLSAMIANITTPGDSLRWIMRGTTFATIAAKLGGAGLPVTKESLFGIPVITGSTSPQQIALVDAGSIVVSYDEAMAVDVNTVASVEMDSAPGQTAIVGTGAQLVSMFSTGAAAIKATLNVAWQPAAVNVGSPTQPAGVAVMSVTY